MNILVCFKVSAQTEQLSAAEKQALCRGGQDPLRYAKPAFGAYDEAALEAALRLREALPSARLAAVTAGSCPARFFTELFALRFDEVTHIDSPLPMDFAAEKVSAALYEYVRREDRFDLIVTGQQAGPGESACVPRMLAARLGWPCISHGYELEALPEGGLRARCHRDGAAQTLTLPARAVFALENARHPYLRLSKVKDRLAAAKKTAAVIPLGELCPGEDHSAPELTRLIEESAPRACRMIEGGVGEQTSALLRGLRGQGA